MIYLSTFPRSGHHFLVETLGFYYPTMRYCERYSCQDQFREPVQCTLQERVSQHPRRLNCPSGANIIKTHDLDVDEPLQHQQGARYLTVIRHPVNAIVSAFRTHVTHKIYSSDLKLHYYDFFSEQLEYYYNFTQKYVTRSAYLSEEHLPSYNTGRHDNSIWADRAPFVYVVYEDLVTGNGDLLMNALKYLSPPTLHPLLDIRRDEINRLPQPQSYMPEELPWCDVEWSHSEVAKYNFQFITKQDGSQLI